MADHSSDRTGRQDDVESLGDRRGETDAAALEAFAIPAPDGLSEDASVTVETPGADESAEPQRRRSRPARTDWRLGGRTVRRWHEAVLAVALIALAVALLVGTLLDTVWSSPLSNLLGTIALWVVFAGVAVYALARSRPVGLFRFRPVDLLYAAGLAVVLRLIQGWLQTRENGYAPFPTATLIDGQPSLEWWVTEALGAVVIAPVTEELFFRGVILVTVYSLLRRNFGELAAGVAAVLVSTGLFVVTHALVLSSDLSGTLAILLLGLVCSALVVLTGRIWGAVLVHVGFNATYLALTVLGTALS